MKSFIENIFRFLFAWIDSLVAWLIKILYDLFYEVSNVMLYSEDVISSIGQRIALLLGIFMLFRLAISLINYLISPDKLNDKSTGGGKILLNIIISLTLLATVNIIFVQAYKIQKIIIDSNIIEKIFFGTQANSTDGLADTDAGYYLYTGLLKPNDEIFEGKCSSLWDIGQYLSGSECADVANNVLQDDIMTVYEARNNRDISIALKNYDLITKRSANHGDKYVFDYYPIISTIAGITAALMLISFTMDLATRAVKLLFLQIIAPIPIISNMDPNKGKNVFEKWYKECFSTYISLFIRIIVINFVSYMIILVTSNFKDIFASNPYLNVLIILGCLMFAKQLPKLIEDLFGIKSSGNMTLNPIKKIQEQALFGSNILGLGAAGLAGAAAFGTNAYATKGNVFKRLGSGVAGLTSATARGTVGALKGQKFSQIYSSAYNASNRARNNRASRQSLDVQASQVWLNSMQRKMGISTTAELQDDDVKIYDQFTSSGDAAVSISEAEIDKNSSRIQLSRFSGTGNVVFNDAVTTATTTYGLNTLAELREAMSDTTRYGATERAELNAAYNVLRGDIAGKYRERTMATVAGEKLDGINSEFKDSTGTAIFNPNTDTAVLTVKAHVENAQDLFEKNKNKDAFVKNGITHIDGENIKSVSKKVKYESTAIKNSNEYRKAHKIQEQTNREKK